MNGPMNRFENTISDSSLFIEMLYNHMNYFLSLLFSISVRLKLKVLNLLSYQYTIIFFSSK